MLEIQIDRQMAKELFLEEVKKRVNELDQSTTMWDTKELKRQTCMSWNTIQDNFFFEEDFPKVKLGGKWYFPAKKTREFLEGWLEKQRHIQ